MPIRVQCANPACAKVMQVKDEFAGRAAKCPGCGASVQIGAPGRVPAAVGAGPAKTHPAPAQPAQRPGQSGADGWIDINEEYAPSRAAGAASVSGGGPPTGDWGQALLQPHGLDASMQEQIRAALTQNERLLWFDRPQQDVLLSRARRHAAGGCFAVVLCLTMVPAIGWFMLREGLADPQRNIGAFAGVGVAGIVGLGGIALGIFAMGTPGRTRRGAAHRPCYLLTNRRVVIHPGVGMQTAMSASGVSSATAYQTGNVLPSYSGPEMFTLIRSEDKKFPGSGELILGVNLFDEPIGGGLTAVGNVAQAEKLLRTKLVHPIVEKLLRGEVSVKGDFGRPKDKPKEDDGDVLPTDGNLKTFAAKLPADPANLKSFKVALAQDVAAAPPAQRKQVEAELAEGEQVLWIGAPAGKGMGGLLRSVGLSNRREPAYNLYAITNRRVLLWSSKGSRGGGIVLGGRVKYGPVSYYPPQLLSAGVEDVSKTSGSIVFRKVKYTIRGHDKQGKYFENVEHHFFGMLHIQNVQAVSQLLFDTLIRPCKQA